MTIKQKLIARLSLPRERWADLAVVGIVIVALLLGLWMRNAALYGTEDFAFDNLGVSGSYPRGWVKNYGDDPVLSVRNPLSDGFDTLLELRKRSLAEGVEATFVLDALALERATAVDLYQSLQTEQVLVADAVAVKRRFTYVEVDRNPYLNRMPTVVYGVDIALRNGDAVFIVTFLADADAFEPDYRYFRAFVEGLEF
jgi:hypothetical protein